MYILDLHIYLYAYIMKNICQTMTKKLITKDGRQAFY